MTSSKNFEKKNMKAENMKKYFVFGVVLALLLIAFGGYRGGKKRARLWSKKKLQCQEKYNGTTICNYEDHPKARMIKVTPSDKDTIVELHNLFRAKAEPPAANMQKLIWDEKLARFAQKWARVCKYGHDNPMERRNPEYQIPIGQNVAYGYRDWTSVLHLWHNEIKQFHTSDKNTWTKQLRDTTARVGCGVAYCPQFRRCYVCNYAFGDSDNSTPLYKEGTPCSDCPNICDGKLCDCKGKICLNGGTLKLANCKCKCPRLYGGSMCSKLKCPRKDRKRCGKKGPNGYPKTSCKDLKIRMECPYMCGLCKKQPRVPKEKSDKKKKRVKKQVKSGTEKPKDGTKLPKSGSKKPKASQSPESPKSGGKTPPPGGKKDETKNLKPETKNTQSAPKNPESPKSSGKTPTPGEKKPKAP